MLSARQLFGDFFVFFRTLPAYGHGHCRERAMSFEVYVRCADVFHCKAVRAMLSSETTRRDPDVR